MKTHCGVCCSLTTGSRRRRLVTPRRVETKRAGAADDRLGSEVVEVGKKEKRKRTGINLNPLAFAMDRKMPVLYRLSIKTGPSTWWRLAVGSRKWSRVGHRHKYEHDAQASESRRVERPTRLRVVLVLPSAEFLTWFPWLPNKKGQASNDPSQVLDDREFRAVARAARRPT